MRKCILVALAVILLMGCGTRVSGSSGPSPHGRAEVNVLKW